jgi:tRNA 5-methylaminomethyl-2-thiouridine biosynthesis bifunctional protein
LASTGLPPGLLLPNLWGGHPQWRILQTSFGEGQDFLAAWHAWKDDERRPRLLHFVAVDAQPVSSALIREASADDPVLRPLAEELASRWHGLLPGVHRFSFEEGRVTLTLHVGTLPSVLRNEAFKVDGIILNSALPDVRALKALARHCTEGCLLAIPEPVHGSPSRSALAECGFFMDGNSEGIFNPEWTRARARDEHGAPASECIVIGGGLAGASVAASLARRGWEVTVLDQAASPAQGASGLPAGLFSPHATPDDNVLSRLSRAGVRTTMQQAAQLLDERADWQPCGVLEHRIDGTAGLPSAWPDEGNHWTRPASAAELTDAKLSVGDAGLWHAQAGWIKPSALVREWLRAPGVEWRGNAEAGSIDFKDGQWTVASPSGEVLGAAPLLVIAAGPASAALAQLAGIEIPLQPIRGQVSWAHLEGNMDTLPAFPVNGDGAIAPAVPYEGGTAWIAGSTFVRDNTDLAPSTQDHAANLDRLRALIPSTATALAPLFESGRIHAWTGIRCASRDRLPVVGELRPGLWISTAMGSRGLTLAALCAELLAARLHAEPLPIEARLAKALDAGRF